MATTANMQEALIGKIIGGRYEVVRLIGKGGMGSVYEVRNTRLGRSFAMKTLTADAAADARMLQRFRREADVIARIKHPNIVEVIDWESLDDGSPAMVMEYLRGEDLSKRIAAGPLAWPLLARIADQMLAALSIAHASGVVHRDLKPENVFLALDDAGDERVKLLDFGVSKVRDSSGLVTTDDRLLGTPAYMSPEQADGRVSDIGTHSDVWAIGAILHEMATGEVAFSAPSVPSILYRICHGNPASLLERRPDAPPAFVELVAATLARDPDRRVASAAELRVRLRDALRDVPGVQLADPLPVSEARLPTLTAAISESPTPSVIARRRAAPAALAIVGLAALAVIVAIAVAVRDKPARSTRSTAAPAPPGEPAAGSASAAAVIEVSAPPDAALPTPLPAVSSGPAKRPSVTRTKPPAADATLLDPAKAEPPKVDVPKVDPKKHCAKDDVECLYGDGT